jgi:hypothetical protein
MSKIEFLFDNKLPEEEQNIEGQEEKNAGEEKPQQPEGMVFHDERLREKFGKEPTGGGEAGAEGAEEEQKPAGSEEKKEEDKAFDFTARFGKTEDEIDAVLKNVDKIVQEHDLLKKSFVDNQNPYPTKTLERMAKLVSDKKLDEQVAYRVASLTDETIDKMGDKELLKLAKIIEAPILLTKESALDELIESEYFVKELDLENMDYTDEEIADSKRKAQIKEAQRMAETSKVRQQLKELVQTEGSETKDPDQVIQAAKEKKEQLQEKWKNAVPMLAEKEFSKIPVKNKDGEVVFTYDVPKELLEEYSKLFADNYGNNLVEFNKENATALFNAMDMSIKSRLFDKIATEIHEAAFSKAVEEGVKAQHNPSGGRREEIKPGGGEKSQRQLVEEADAAREGTTRQGGVEWIG